MEKRKKNLVVLVSGSGSNMAAILDAIDRGEINGEVKAVISSNAEAYALTRAAVRKIPAYVCARAAYENAEARDREILRLCRLHDADYILLAGYLGIVSPCIVEAYPYKIVNIHPALFPQFGGKGFFGIHVHEAVLAAGEKESGATVHFVDQGTDTGPIILQKAVEVRQGDTPETLQRRVMEEAEWVIMPRAIDLIANGRIQVTDGIAAISEEMA